MRGLGLGFRDEGSGFMRRGRSANQVWGFGFRVSCLGLGVSGFGLRVEGLGLGFRVWGVGFRVESLTWNGAKSNTGESSACV